MPMTTPTSASARAVSTASTARKVWRAGAPASAPWRAPAGRGSASAVSLSSFREWLTSSRALPDVLLCSVCLEASTSLSGRF